VSRRLPGESALEVLRLEEDDDSWVQYRTKSPMEFTCAIYRVSTSKIGVVYIASEGCDSATKNFMLAGLDDTVVASDICRRRSQGSELPSAKIV
jgi:hypothetical protein